MLRKLVPMMIAASALGLLAGCGGEDEPASDAPAQQESSPAAESTPTPAATAGEASGGSTDERVQDAIKRCKETVQAQTQVSAETRADLEKTCEAAASGDPDAAKKAAADVCVKVVEDTVPEGPARDAALESCKTAAP